MSEYHGFPTHRISSPYLQLDCLSTAGPRIVRLSYKGSPNLFAELPEISLPTPYGDYRYLGGHRLWHAPEALPRSYIPDEDGLLLSERPHGLFLEGKTEPGTSMRKSIEFRLEQDRAAVVLTHKLSNEGLWEVEVSPWSITMFRLGGMVIFPIRRAGMQIHSLLPDRSLALWPYNSINDPRLALSDDFILLEARKDLPPFKVGAFNPLGWIAYWRDGILFRKTFEVSDDLTYPDYGCNAETYCDSDFVELESLGPLKKLAPGGSLQHTETWELFDSLDQEFISRAVSTQLLGIG